MFPKFLKKSWEQALNRAPGVAQVKKSCKSVADEYGPVGIASAIDGPELIDTSLIPITMIFAWKRQQRSGGKCIAKLPSQKLPFSRKIEEVRRLASIVMRMATGAVPALGNATVLPRIDRSFKPLIDVFIINCRERQSDSSIPC